MKNKQKNSAFSPLLFNKHDRDLFCLLLFYKFISEMSKTLECPLSDVSNLCSPACDFVSCASESEFFQRFRNIQNELRFSVKLFDSGLYYNEK